MVRWCGGFFGSITSHAQSTACTYFIGAVKSDVVHRIVVCWALWLQSGEAEQIVHIRSPTETFAHARVDVKPIAISFMCIPSRNKAWIAAASSARPKSVAVRQLIMERWCGVLGAEQCWLLVAVFSELNGLPQESIHTCHILSQCKLFCIHAAYHDALGRRSWG